KLGREHLDTLKAALDLAAVYVVDGKPEKAEPLAVEVVAGRKRQLGAGDKDTVIAMILLAGVYQNEKNISPAAAVATEAYDAARRSLGENATLTTAAKTLSQTVSAALNRTATSEKAARDVLGDLSKSLETKQVSSLPEMINAAIAIASLASAQGHPEQAERALVDALDAVQRAGGGDLLLMWFLIDTQESKKI